MSYVTAAPAPKDPPMLVHLPACGVIGCAEIAGHQRGLVVAFAGAGQRRLQVQTWAYTCTAHAEELSAFADGGAR